MKIGVIGLSGVGMAQVVAAARSGHEVVALIDHDPRVLLRARQAWSNDWLDVHEAADVQRDTVYLTSLAQPLPDCDLVIVATPPHTHAEIVHLLRPWGMRIGHILLEKPAHYPDRPVIIETSDVTVSGEWVHHDALRSIDRLESLEMRFPESHTTRWGYDLPIEFDFTPHYFSVMEAKGYRVQALERVLPGAIVAHTLRGDVWLRYARHAPYGFFVNDRCLDWQADLFDQQLRAGRGPLTWSRAGYLESLLWGCL